MRTRQRERNWWKIIHSFHSLQPQSNNWLWWIWPEFFQSYRFAHAHPRREQSPVVGMLMPLDTYRRLLPKLLPPIFPLFLKVLKRNNWYLYGLRTKIIDFCGFFGKFRLLNSNKKYLILKTSEHVFLQFLFL